MKFTDVREFILPKKHLMSDLTRLSTWLGEFLLSGIQISLNVAHLLFWAAFSASEGNFPSLHTPFSLFCALAGGFYLTFAGLTLSYLCDSSFLSLLSKYKSTPVAHIFHLGELIEFYYPANRAQPKQNPCKSFMLYLSVRNTIHKTNVSTGQGGK